MARELAANSADFLSRWKVIVGNEAAFAPEKSEQTFNIQVTDFVLQDIVARTVSELRTIAPRIIISVSPPA